MKYMPDETLDLPLYLRQAIADENFAPQQDQGSLKAMLERAQKGALQ